MLYKAPIPSETYGIYRLCWNHSTYLTSITTTSLVAMQLVKDKHEVKLFFKIILNINYLSVFNKIGFKWMYCTWFHFTNVTAGGSYILQPLLSKSTSILSLSSSNNLFITKEAPNIKETLSELYLLYRKVNKTTKIGTQMLQGSTS